MHLASQRDSLEDLSELQVAFKVVQDGRCVRVVKACVARSAFRNCSFKGQLRLSCHRNYFSQLLLNFDLFLRVIRQIGEAVKIAINFILLLSPRQKELMHLTIIILYIILGKVEISDAVLGEIVAKLVVRRTAAQNTMLVLANSVSKRTRGGSVHRAQKGLLFSFEKLLKSRLSLRVVPAVQVLA